VVLKIKYFEQLEKHQSKSVSQVENVNEFWDFGNETVYETKG